MTLTSTLARTALLPWHALQVFTGAKSFRGNAILGSEALNRRGLHVWRVKLAAKVVAARRRKLEKLVSAADRADFDRDGYVAKRGVLDDATFAQLVQEIETLSAPAREMKEGNAITRRISLTPELLAQMPATRAFLETDAWRNLIRYIGGFDVEPVLCIQTIFARPRPEDGKPDPQISLHMDTFHSTVKAWYFLQDVGPDEGPFTYVPGSHKLTPRRLAWHKRQSVLASREGRGGAFRITPAELPRLHLPPATRFDVPANTLVVGDTLGFHARGLTARPSVRVEIYASQRPNPYLPFTWIDSAILPFVRGRKHDIGWAMQDLGVKLGIARNIWRKVGTVTPRGPRPKKPD